MRLYSASDEEALRARSLLKDWAGQGFLTQQQYDRAQQETVCDLRCTNLFLRLVFFLFTLLIVGAVAGLVLVVFLSRSPAEVAGSFLLIFAAVLYGAAEVAVSETRIYRYGIEEALVASSVVSLCAGIAAIAGGRGVLIPGTGAVFSVWIWHRFGLPYAFLAGMVFALFVPGHWTSSHTALHLIVAAFYAIGLAAVAAIRPRHRFDYLNEVYSLVEAFLWLGIYLAMNLRLPSWELLTSWLYALPPATNYPGPFYWATWVLIWCLPPAVLARGLRHKDRFVIAAGALIAILTLVTNKPYLGWQRHTWDPMLLGALLIGVAVYLRRWLARGPGGIRHGFTAQRLSVKQKEWANAAAAGLGLVSPHPVAPQTSTPTVRFGGGDSGGGGATSDF